MAEGEPLPIVSTKIRDLLGGFVTRVVAAEASARSPEPRVTTRAIRRRPPNISTYKHELHPTQISRKSSEKNATFWAVFRLILLRQIYTVVFLLQNADSPDQAGRSAFFIDLLPAAQYLMKNAIPTSRDSANFDEALPCRQRLNAFK